MAEKDVPSNVAELLVVRHGETTWNAVSRLQVAERLASLGLPIAAVYSSDLHRAADTAHAIGEKCKCAKVVLKENLRERNLGDLQGYTRTEARVAVPEAYKAFTSADDNLPIPGGGESLEQLIVRAEHVMEEIAAQHLGERVVVVTHGGVLRSLHIIAKGVPTRTKVTNASVNVFHISDENDWTLCSWDDVNHLRGVGFLSSGFGGDNQSG